MKNHQRVAIADRSLLAHNIYETLLKPEGFTLFLFRTLREFKERLDLRLDSLVLLINSNTFGNHFDRHCQWFLQESSLDPLHKIFLCEASERKIQTLLHKIKKSHFLTLPFHPSSLKKMLKELFLSGGVAHR